MLLYTFTAACLALAVENFIIGPVAYRLHRSNLTTRFLFLCISAGIVGLGLGLSVISDNRTIALFWCRLMLCGVTFTAVTFFHFSAVLIDVAKKKDRFIRCGYIIAVIFVFITLLGGTAPSVSPKYIFKYHTDAGPFHPFLVLYFSIYVIYGIYLQVRAALKARGYERIKITYVLAASALGFGSAPAMFFASYNLWPYAFLGMYVAWIYPLVFAYSILTVRVMDIEIFIHRTTRALISIVIFFFILYTAYFTFQGFLQGHFKTFWFIIPTLVFGIGLVGLVFFIKHVFHMNEEDLSTKFAYRPILKEVAKRAAEAETVEELLAFTARFISVYARLDYIGIFLLEQRKEYYEMLGSQTRPPKESYVLVRSHARTPGRKKLARGLEVYQDNPIISRLIGNGEVINFSQVAFDLEKRPLPFHKKKEQLRLKREMQKWKVELCVPCYSEGVLIGVFLLGERINKEMFLSKDEELFLTITDQLAKPIQNFFYKKQAIEGFIRSQDVVIRAVEAKDPYTKGHSERVSEISYILGKRLGLSKSELQYLKYAARLHDIGKIAIKDSILNKEGALTPGERTQIETHPMEAVKMIQPIAPQLGSDAIEGILQHHENVDGSGYPKEQKGDDIHIFAKIIRTVDTLDALASSRPYRRKPTFIKKIIEEFNINSGKLFDAEITQEMVNLCEDEGFVQYLKRLIKNTGAVSRI